MTPLGQELIREVPTLRASQPLRTAITTLVEVPSDFSYAQLAETFLHHRVAVLPVVDEGRVVGAVTRRDYVRALAEKLPDV